MKSTDLTVTVKRAFHANRIPVLIDPVSAANPKSLAKRASRAGTPTFTIRNEDPRLPRPLVIERVATLGALGRCSVTTAHPHLERAIEYAQLNPAHHPVIIFNRPDEGSPGLLEQVFTMAATRRLGSIRLPSNLKLLITLGSIEPLTGIESAQRARFTVSYVSELRRAALAA